MAGSLVSGFGHPIIRWDKFYKYQRLGQEVFVALRRSEGVFFCGIRWSRGNELVRKGKDEAIAFLWIEGDRKLDFKVYCIDSHNDS
jgi:hypothetical protein